MMSSTLGRHLPFSIFVLPDAVDAVLDYVDALLDPPAEVITAGASHRPRFAGLCRELHQWGTSSRMPTSRRWHSSNERSSSRSTADSGATHG